MHLNSDHIVTLFVVLIFKSDQAKHLIDQDGRLLNYIYL